MTSSLIARAVLALVLVGALVAPAAGDAQHETAEQLFTASGEQPDTEAGYRRALELSTRALQLWVESGDLAGQAKCLNRIGQIHRQSGETARAVSPYRRALALFRQIGDLASEANQLNNLAFACAELDQPQPARVLYEMALTRFRETGSVLGQAPLLRNLGNVLLTLGEVGAACEAFEDARELAWLAGDGAGEGRSLNGIARCRLALGETAHAAEAYESAFELGRRAGDEQLQAGALNNLADIDRRQGNLSAALEHQYTANELWGRLGQKALVADGLQNLGTLYVALGQLRLALERYQEALELYRAVGKPRFAALASLSVSWVRLSRGEIAPAVEELEQLAAEPAVVSDPRLGSDVARTLGFAHLSAGRPGVAERFFEQALVRGRQLEDLDRVARSLAGLGEACAALGTSERAQASFSEALALGGKLSNPTVEAISLRGLARLARDRGELEPALALAEQALERVERGRRQVPTPELRGTFLAGQQEYYELQLDLLVRLNRRDPGRGYDTAAFEASERARSRSLLDLLSERGEDTGAPREPVFAERERALEQQLAELRRELESAPGERRSDFERKLSKIDEERQRLEVEIRGDASPYGALRRLGVTASLAQVQQRLEPGTALVEYALGQKSSLGFVVTREAVLSFEIAATAAEIGALVEQVRSALATPGRRGLGAYRQAAWKLYQLLFAPEKNRLEGVERLIVVPDRGLYALPFEVLLTAAPGSSPATLEELPYLLARFSVSYAPSASVLALLERMRGRPAGGLVVFADPADTGLPELPASAAEAEAIAALYPPEQSRLFLGAQANENNVKNEATVHTARRLHFATHGRLDERWPQLSALELSREPGSAEDGRLHVYEILRLGLEAELVVLSACETALGQEVRGEGLIGLARAFLLAGAERVAVSLWRVDDAATAALMPRFYRHLADRPSTAEALRAAKLELISGGRFAHPSHWASFILVGLP